MTEREKWAGKSADMAEWREQKSRRNVQNPYCDRIEKWYLDSSGYRIQHLFAEHRYRSCREL